ncbi:hypothetical protein IBE20_07895 [Francisella tularensis subsp. novicida]|uniref:Uncharacterized protein n=2 Tax=Francisella tularensis TaxID=263 RepID=A0A6I4RS09_FRATU|nr:hypothetical protein [Francisella tularensis]ABK89598.1 hypothetical membrane protein [Francisella tularensis subsp. novicida U112]AJI61652.1 putative membrane protein [Francisella tularensis subsp. novicida U112]EDX19942.1 hypothetical protein FTE_1767 [Francisella tularensis subsp. novicida FTE]MBK2036629.1 hypothetical protein [Francisella tularensis subsp. novicida]MBK2117171.1 hypothetical protein [Francisella tularensis subsp. novicida]
MKNKNIMIVLAVFFDLLLSFIVIGFEGCANNNLVLCVMTCSLAMTHVLKESFIKSKRYNLLSFVMFVLILPTMIAAVIIARYGFVRLEIFLFFISIIFFFLPILSLKDLIKKDFNNDFGIALFGVNEHFQKVIFFIREFFVMLAYKDFGLVLRIAEQTTTKTLKFGK